MAGEGLEGGWGHTPGLKRPGVAGRMGQSQAHWNEQFMLVPKGSVVSSRWYRVMSCVRQWSHISSPRAK